MVVESGVVEEGLEARDEVSAYYDTGTVKWLKFYKQADLSICKVSRF